MLWSVLDLVEQDQGFASDSDKYFIQNIFVRDGFDTDVINDEVYQCRTFNVTNFAT